MPTCEQDIIDIAVVATLPDANEMVMFTDASGVTVLRKWSTINAGATPPDEEYVTVSSGSTTGNVVVGEASFTLATFVNRRVRLYRNGILQPRTQVAGGNYYSFNAASATFTVSPLPGPEEIFHVQAY